MPPRRTATPATPAPPAPLAPAARPPPAPQPAREQEALPTLDVYLRFIRQEVARGFQMTPEARAREEQNLVTHAVSLRRALRVLSSQPSRSPQNRALSRYPSLDKTALPPPLKQIDAYLKAPPPNESLFKYLEARRADLALDELFQSDVDDKDGSGELSPDPGRDSDEDAIGSEHPKSPSLGPSASPGGAQRQLQRRNRDSSLSSPLSTAGTNGHTTGMFDASLTTARD